MELVKDITIPPDNRSVSVSPATLTIKTSKFIRSIERAIEVTLKLIGLYLTYLVFNALGRFLLESDYRADTLFSLVLLPALYIIKDAHIIITPYFVKVVKAKKFIEVQTGIFTQRIDKLGFETVENIEVVKTLGGRWFNYGSIYLYAHGSWVTLPSVINPEKVQSDIEASLKLKFD
jgi:hypothetical protein